MKSFSARLFDGQTAGSRVVTIQFIESNGIRLIDADSQAHFGFDKLTIEKRLSGHPAVVELPDGGRIEVPATDEFFAALKTNVDESNWVFWLESHWLSVLISLVVTAFVIWGGVTYGIPAAAKKAVEFIPAELDDAIGEHALSLLDRGFLASTELGAGRRAELSAKFTDITDAVGEGHVYRLEFRRGDALGANALALPSGIVILTDELVAIAANDDEIAMVLAHEIGHVRHSHTLRAIMQNSASAALIIAITGDVGSVANIAAGIPTFMVERSYSRDFEREADDVAFDFQTSTGIDGQPLADLLTRIDAEYGNDDAVSNLLSTHPRSVDRVR